MRKLFIIPARGGSKGLPGKNIRILNNKPLIHYTIEDALAVKESNDRICLTSDDNEIIAVCKNFNELDILISIQNFII